MELSGPSRASHLENNDPDIKDTSVQEASIDILEHHSGNQEPSSTRSPQPDIKPAATDKEEQIHTASTAPTIPEESAPDPDIKDSPTTIESNQHSIEPDNKEPETTDPVVQHKDPDAEVLKESPPKDNDLEPVSDPVSKAELNDGITTDISSQASKEDTKPKRANRPGKYPGQRVPSPTGNGPNPEARNTKPRFVPRPNLICRDAGEQWEILLSIPKESNVIKVFQQNEHLPIANGKCRLENFTDPLTLIKDRDEREELILAEHRPLIFKTSNDWTNDGRQVRYITNGHFIVIAPSLWACQAEVSVEPEECLDPDYLAHFIYSSKKNNSDRPVFDNCEELRKADISRLSGTTISDASQKGKLYVKCPPELYSSQEIVWARVGLEGRGQDAWGENFEPHKEALAKVLDGREGYFFIRVYDKENRLVDSDHFRYFSNLKEIKLNGITYSPDQYILPSESDGHTPAIIEFISNDGQHLHLEIEEGQEVERRGGAITLAIEPDQHLNDEVTCNLKSPAGKEVEIVLAIPRVWWKLEQQDKTGLWYDTPMQLTREKFLEYAGSDTRLFFRPKTIGTVKCGFNHNMTQTLPIRDGLMLSSFMDYRELQSPISQVIGFGVTLNESKTLTLINIVADQTPGQNLVGVHDPVAVPLEGDARAGAIGAQTHQPSPEQNRVPFAYVKKGKVYLREDNDLRRGKGFSDNELISAGLSPSNKLNLSYDKRRRTSHQFNVEKIKDWKQQCLPTKT